MIVDTELEAVSDHKKRDPLSCLVIQNDVGNNYSSTTVVAAISPAEEVKKLSPVNVLLTKGIAGLTIDCVVLCDQLRSIPQERLTHVRGKLDHELMRQVDRALRISLSLDQSGTV